MLTGNQRVVTLMKWHRQLGDPTSAWLLEGRLRRRAEPG